MSLYRVTSGELASSNFFQLQKLSKALAACISRTEVEAQYQHFMKIEKSTLALQIDMANLSKVADELNQSHLLINQRLGTAESAITQKLDRSELMHVQALASKVSLYDDFRLKTLQCIEELYIAKADLEETVGEHSETLLKHANELQGLTALSTKLATKRDIHTLAREIEKHSAEIAVCVTMPTFNQLDQRVDDLSSSLHSCAELVQTHDQHIDRMQKALKTKATVQQVEKCVLKEDYVEFLAMNDENMASKAPLSVTDVLKLELQVFSYVYISNLFDLAITSSYLTFCYSVLTRCCPRSLVVWTWPSALWTGSLSAARATSTTSSSSTSTSRTWQSGVQGLGEAWECIPMCYRDRG